MTFLLKRTQEIKSGNWESPMGWPGRGCAGRTGLLHEDKGTAWARGEAEASHGTLGPTCPGTSPREWGTRRVRARLTRGQPMLTKRDTSQGERRRACH